MRLPWCVQLLTIISSRRNVLVSGKSLWSVHGVLSQRGSITVAPELLRARSTFLVRLEVLLLKAHLFFVHVEPRFVTTLVFPEDAPGKQIGKLNSRPLPRIAVLEVER